MFTRASATRIKTRVSGLPIYGYSNNNANFILKYESASEYIAA